MRLPEGLELSPEDWAGFGSDFIHLPTGSMLYGDSGWIGTIDNWDTERTRLDLDSLTRYSAYAGPTGLHFVPEVDPLTQPTAQSTAQPLAHPPAAQTPGRAPGTAVHIPLQSSLNPTGRPGDSVQRQRDLATEVRQEVKRLTEGRSGSPGAPEGRPRTVDAQKVARWDTQLPVTNYEPLHRRGAAIAESILTGSPTETLGGAKKKHRVAKEQPDAGQRGDGQRGDGQPQTAGETSRQGRTRVPAVQATVSDATRLEIQRAVQDVGRDLTPGNRASARGVTLAFLERQPLPQGRPVRDLAAAVAATFRGGFPDTAREQSLNHPGLFYSVLNRVGVPGMLLSTPRLMPVLAESPEVLKVLLSVPDTWFPRNGTALAHALLHGDVTRTLEADTSLLNFTLRNPHILINGHTRLDVLRRASMFGETLHALLLSRVFTSELLATADPLRLVADLALDSGLAAALQNMVVHRAPRTATELVREVLGDRQLRGLLSRHPAQQNVALSSPEVLRAVQARPEVLSVLDRSPELTDVLEDLPGLAHSLLTDEERLLAAVENTNVARTLSYAPESYDGLSGPELTAKLRRDEAPPPFTPPALQPPPQLAGDGTDAGDKRLLINHLRAHSGPVAALFARRHEHPADQQAILSLFQRPDVLKRMAHSPHVIDMPHKLRRVLARPLTAQLRLPVDDEVSLTVMVSAARHRTVADLYAEPDSIVLSAGTSRILEDSREHRTALYELPLVGSIALQDLRPLVGLSLEELRQNPLLGGGLVKRGMLLDLAKHEPGSFDVLANGDSALLRLLHGHPEILYGMTTDTWSTLVRQVRAAPDVLGPLTSAFGELTSAQWKRFLINGELLTLLQERQTEPAAQVLTAVPGLLREAVARPAQAVWDALSGPALTALDSPDRRAASSLTPAAVRGLSHAITSAADSLLTPEGFELRSDLAPARARLLQGLQRGETADQLRSRWDVDGTDLTPDLLNAYRFVAGNDEIRRQAILHHYLAEGLFFDPHLRDLLAGRPSALDLLLQPDALGILRQDPRIALLLTHLDPVFTLFAAEPWARSNFHISIYPRTFINNPAYATALRIGDYSTRLGERSIKHIEDLLQGSPAVARAFGARVISFGMLLESHALVHELLAADENVRSALVATRERMEAAASVPHLVRLMMALDESDHELPHRVMRPDLLPVVRAAPEFVTVLARTPEGSRTGLTRESVRQLIVRNPELVPRLLENDGLRTALAERPALANLMLTDPVVRRQLLDRPELAEAVRANRALISYAGQGNPIWDVVSTHPVLARGLNSRIRGILEQNPWLADQLKNLSDPPAPDSVASLYRAFRSPGVLGLLSSHAGFSSAFLRRPSWQERAAGDAEFAGAARRLFTADPDLAAGLIADSEPRQLLDAVDRDIAARAAASERPAPKRATRRTRGVRALADPSASSRSEPRTEARTEVRAETRAGERTAPGGPPPSVPAGLSPDLVDLLVGPHGPAVLARMSESPELLPLLKADPTVVDEIGQNPDGLKGYTFRAYLDEHLPTPTLDDHTWLTEEAAFNRRFALYLDAIAISYTTRDRDLISDGARHTWRAVADQHLVELSAQEAHRTANLARFRSNDRGTWEYSGRIHFAETVSEQSFTAAHMKVIGAVSRGQSVEETKPLINRALHAHLNGGSGGVAFFYTLADDGRVDLVVHAMSTDRRGNDYRWNISNRSMAGPPPVDLVTHNPRLEESRDVVDEAEGRVPPRPDTVPRPGSFPAPDRSEAAVVNEAREVAAEIRSMRNPVVRRFEPDSAMFHRLDRLAADARVSRLLGTPLDPGATPGPATFPRGDRTDTRHFTPDTLHRAAERAARAAAEEGGIDRADPADRSTWLINCVILLRHLTAELYADNSQAAPARFGPVGVRAAVTMDDLGVRSPSAERLLAPGPGWAPVTSWQTLTETLHRAGPGTTALILTQRASTDPDLPGHAYAAHQTTEGLRWIEMRTPEGPLITKKPQPAIPHLLDARAFPGADPLNTRPLHTRAVIVDHTGQVVRDALPDAGTPRLTDTLVDPPVNHESAATGFEAELRLPLSNLPNGASYGDVIARHKDKLEITLDKSTFFRAKGKLYESEHTARSRSRHYTTESRLIPEVVLPPLAALPKDDGRLDASRGLELYRETRHLLSEVNRRSGSMRLTDLLREQDDWTVDPRFKDAEVDPAPIDNRDAAYVQFTTGVPVAGLTHILELALARFSPDGEPEVFAAGRAFADTVAAEYATQLVGATVQAAHLPFLLELPGLSELRGYLWLAHSHVIAIPMTFNFDFGLIKHLLPAASRTSFADMRGTLSPRVQAFLRNNRKSITRTFERSLEDVAHAYAVKEGHPRPEPVKDLMRLVNEDHVSARRYLKTVLGDHLEGEAVNQWDAVGMDDYPLDVNEGRYTPGLALIEVRYFDVDHSLRHRQGDAIMTDAAVEASFDEINEVAVQGYEWAQRLTEVPTSLTPESARKIVANRLADHLASILNRTDTLTVKVHHRHLPVLPLADRGTLIDLVRAYATDGRLASAQVRPLLVALYDGLDAAVERGRSARRDGDRVDLDTVRRARNVVDDALVLVDEITDRQTRADRQRSRPGAGVEEITEGVQNLTSAPPGPRDRRDPQLQPRRPTTGNLSALTRYPVVHHEAVAGRERQIAEARSRLAKMRQDHADLWRAHAARITGSVHQAPSPHPTSPQERAYQQVFSKIIDLVAGRGSQVYNEHLDRARELGRVRSDKAFRGEAMDIAVSRAKDLSNRLADEFGTKVTDPAFVPAGARPAPSHAGGEAGPSRLDHVPPEEAPPYGARPFALPPVMEDDLPPEAPAPAPAPAPGPSWVGQDLDERRPPRLDRDLPPPERPARAVEFTDGRTLPVYMGGVGRLLKELPHRVRESSYSFGQSERALRGAGLVVEELGRRLDVSAGVRPVPSSRGFPGRTGLLDDVRNRLERTPQNFFGDGQQFGYRTGNGRSRILTVTARPYEDWTRFAFGYANPVKVDTMVRDTRSTGVNSVFSSATAIQPTVPIGPPADPLTGWGRVSALFVKSKRVLYTMQNHVAVQNETRTTDDSHPHLTDVWLRFTVTDRAGLPVDHNGDAIRGANTRAEPLDFGFAVRNGLYVRLAESLTTRQPDATRAGLPDTITFGPEQGYRTMNTEGYGPLADVRAWAIEQLGAKPNRIAVSQLNDFFSSEGFQRMSGTLAAGPVTTAPLFRDDAGRRPLGVFSVRVTSGEAVLLDATRAAEVRNIVQTVVRNERTVTKSSGFEVSGSGGPGFHFFDLVNSQVNLRLLIGGSARYTASRSRTSATGGAGSVRSASQIKGDTTGLYLVRKIVTVTAPPDTRAPQPGPRPPGQQSGKLVKNSPRQWSEPPRTREFETWSLERLPLAEARRLAGLDSGAAVLSPPPAVPPYLSEDRPPTLGMSRVEEFGFDDGRYARTGADGRVRTLPEHFADQVLRAVADAYPDLVAPLGELNPANPRWRGTDHFQLALSNTLEVLNSLSAQNMAGNLETMTTTGLRIPLIGSGRATRERRYVWVDAELTERRYEGTRADLRLRYSAPGTETLTGRQGGSRGVYAGVEGLVSVRDTAIDGIGAPQHAGTVSMGGNVGIRHESESGYGATVTHEAMSIGTKGAHLYSYRLTLTARRGGFWRFRGLLRAALFGVLGTQPFVRSEPRSTLIGPGAPATGGPVVGRVLLSVPVEHTPSDAAGDPARVSVDVRSMAQEAALDLARPKHALAAGTERRPAQPYESHPHLTLNVVAHPALAQAAEDVLASASDGSWQLTLHGAPPHDAALRLFQSQYLAANFDQSSSPTGSRAFGLWAKRPFINRSSHFVHRTRITPGSLTAVTRGTTVNAETTLGGITTVGGRSARTVTVFTGFQAVYTDSHNTNPGLTGGYGVVASPYRRDWTDGRVVTRTVVAEINRKDMGRQVLVSGEVQHELVAASVTAGQDVLAGPSDISGVAGRRATVGNGWWAHVPEKSAYRLNLLEDSYGDVPLYTDRGWSPQLWLAGTPFGGFPVNSLDSTAVLRDFYAKLVPLGLSRTDWDTVQRLVSGRVVRALGKEQAGAGFSVPVRISGRLPLTHRLVQVRAELIPVQVPRDPADAGRTGFGGLGHSVELEEHRQAVETFQTQSNRISSATVGTTIAMGIHTTNDTARSVGPTVTEAGLTQRNTAQTHSEGRVRIATATTTQAHGEYVTAYRLRLTAEIVGDVARDIREQPAGQPAGWPRATAKQSLTRIVSEDEVGELIEHHPLSLMRPDPVRGAGTGADAGADHRLDPPELDPPGEPRPVPVPAVGTGGWHAVWHPGERTTKPFEMPEDGFKVRQINGLDRLHKANTLAMAAAYDVTFPRLDEAAGDAAGHARLLDLAKDTRLTRPGSGPAQNMEDGTGNAALTAFYDRTLTADGYRVPGLETPGHLRGAKGDLVLYSRPDLARAQLLTVADAMKHEAPRRDVHGGGMSVTHLGATQVSVGFGPVIASPGTGANQTGAYGPGDFSADSDTLGAGGDRLASVNVKPNTSRTFLFAVPTIWLTVAEVRRPFEAARGTFGNARRGPQALETRTTVLAWVREDIARKLGLIDDTRFPAAVDRAWQAVTRADQEWTAADRAYWDLRRGRGHQHDTEVRRAGQVLRDRADADAVTAASDLQAVNRAERERRAFAEELGAARERAEHLAAELARVREGADRLTRWHQLNATEEGRRRLDGLPAPDEVTFTPPPPAPGRVAAGKKPAARPLPVPPPAQVPSRAAEVERMLSGEHTLKTVPKVGPKGSRKTAPTDIPEENPADVPQDTPVTPPTPVARPAHSGPPWLPGRAPEPGRPRFDAATDHRTLTALGPDGLGQLFDLRVQHGDGNNFYAAVQDARGRAATPSAVSDLSRVVAFGALPAEVTLDPNARFRPKELARALESHFRRDPTLAALIEEGGGRLPDALHQGLTEQERRKLVRVNLRSARRWDTTTAALAAALTATALGIDLTVVEEDGSHTHYSGARPHTSGPRPGVTVYHRGDDYLSARPRESVAPNTSR
ncbi:hypothetical protein ACIQAC_25535 [Streptomyces sp. NPDC088387]|uniref:hypothetical protein n=1 Tax=Streptomyces sp. NPDC088387 TaxID=3365859 RepID=UPI00380199D3